VRRWTSTTGCSALDVHSTHVGLSSGRAREVNPLLRDVAHNPAALIAVKAASGIVVIYATEKLGKRNRKAAILTMIGVNAVTAAIVAHNYRQGR
jgi:hypothetical protein